jgi:hypothetical protein
VKFRIITEILKKFRKNGGNRLRNLEKSGNRVKFKKFGRKIISAGGDRRPLQEDQ